MNSGKIEDVLGNQIYKIHDVQSLLTAISMFDPGGSESRLARMANEQLTEIANVLDTIDMTLSKAK